MKRILGVAALVLAVGCAQPERKTEPSFRALGKTVTPEKSPSDETIGFEVRRRLNMVAPAETAGVIVEVVGGVVTLRGAAPTQIDIQRAVGVARGVPGVKDVVSSMHFSTPNLINRIPY